ncbi:cysteine desulfurase family protein [Fusibacter bizertensis]|uniref:Cysteine desulfurase family protein n=1 Tax=Fusibacter bizertensis TaxID=1488331 RepID=A0ABT6N9S8_9FIRM|nr:cysteine desulfurase family protein [Fusibacter bizertensis]MDH8677168.1 cysteine desulfurase family protein [Fusibacter bizertensis]
MSIYLDYAATTPLSNIVKKSIVENLDYFGNPSSMHSLGVASEKKIKHTRRLISEELNVKDSEVIFTSGGTEANNLAIFGLLANKQKGRIITSKIEHPSVLNAFEQLKKKGLDVIFIGIDHNGQIDIDELKSAINEETLLVSVMYINNEIGSIQPIEEIGSLISQYNKMHKTSIYFHVDAVQAFGKIDIDFKKLNVDAMSISAHKIYALKGVGALVCKYTSLLKPLFYGGQQEFTFRPGTENLLGIIAFGEAIKSFEGKIKKNNEHVEQLKNKMLKKFENIDDIVVNGSSSSPYILNVSFLGVKGEVMLHSLEMKEIYVATGSACSSKKKNYSHVLMALGCSEAKLESAIRISFGENCTIDEIEEAADIMIQTATELKKIMNKGKRR